MFVIIPHPTEELKLINLQKQLISNLWDENTLLAACSPLWIPVDFPLENLKKDIKKIKKITVNTPVLDEEYIYCNITVDTESGSYETRMNLLQLIKKSCQKIIIPAGLSLDFPLNIKIFRLGIAVNNSVEHSSAIQDSVWCKLT